MAKPCYIYEFRRLSSCQFDTVQNLDASCSGLWLVTVQSLSWLMARVAVQNLDTWLCDLASCALMYLVSLVPLALVTTQRGSPVTCLCSCQVPEGPSKPWTPLLVVFQHCPRFGHLFWCL